MPVCYSHLACLTYLAIVVLRELWWELYWRFRESCKRTCNILSMCIRNRRIFQNNNTHINQSRGKLFLCSSLQEVYRSDLIPRMPHQIRSSLKLCSSPFFMEFYNRKLGYIVHHKLNLCWCGLPPRSFSLWNLCWLMDKISFRRACTRACICMHACMHHCKN